MKTKKQLIKTVVRTIKSILATVLLLTCIEYFPTVASAEGEDAGTANETISEYGSTELAEAAEQSQEGSTIIVNQPQQEEQASEPAQEQQEEAPVSEPAQEQQEVTADIQQQNVEQPSNTEDNSQENNSEQTLVQNDENKEVSENQEVEEEIKDETPTQYAYVVKYQYTDELGNITDVKESLSDTTENFTVNVTIENVIGYIVKLNEGEDETTTERTYTIDTTKKVNEFVVEYEKVEETSDEVEEVKEENTTTTSSSFSLRNSSLSLGNTEGIASYGLGSGSTYTVDQSVVQITKIEWTKSKNSSRYLEVYLVIDSGNPQLICESNSKNNKVTIYYSYDKNLYDLGDGSLESGKSYSYLSTNSSSPTKFYIYLNKKVNDPTITIADANGKTTEEYSNLASDFVLAATVTNCDGCSVSWNSSNSSVANIISSDNSQATIDIVDNSDMTAATIKATVTKDGETYTSNEYIVNIHKAQVTVVPANSTIGKGETVTLTATLEDYSADIEWNWSVEGSSLSIDENGTVTGNENISEKQVNVSTTINGVTYSGSAKVSVVDTFLTIVQGNGNVELGSTLNLTASYAPSNGTVIWEDDGTGFATVDENGVVTGEATGSSEITAKLIVDEQVVATDSITVTVSRSTYGDTEQNAYFYLMIPGMDSLSDQAPEKWVYGGKGNIIAPSKDNYNNRDIVQNANINGMITVQPTYYLNKTITVNGKTYRFDSNNTGESGTFSIVWDKVVMSPGANNSNLWDGESGINDTTVASGKQWHVDGHMILHDDEYANIEFRVMYPGSSVFELVSKPSLVKQGTNKNEITVPSMETTKTYNGVTYVFDGWYANSYNPNGAKENFNEGTVTQDTVWYAKYIPNISISAEGGSWTYDGKAHSASASVTGAEYYTVYYKVGSGEWTTTAPSVTNVEDGEVTVSVKATRTGYEDLTAEDVKIKINARPVTITVDSKEKYFGTEDPTFTGSITSGSLVATNDLGTITYSRTNTAEAVGPYEGVLTASYTENKNYSVTVVPGNFEIKTASIAGASLSATGGSWTYDGKAHSASASVTGAEYYTVYYKVGSGEWTTTAPSVTNVEDGEVTVSVKATRTGYEDLTAEDVKIKINARPVTITVDSKEKYFGTEDPTFTGSITSGSLVATNDLGTITYSRTNTAEAVGPYEGVLTASYTENKNYSVTVVPGNFEIKTASIAGASLSATGGSWTYDGKAHSASASVTGAEYYTVYYKVGSGEWTTTAPSVTNVEDGEVTVSVKATRTGYEDLTAEDVKIKINARPVTITVDSKEKYFGTEDPTFTGSITSGSLVATNDLGTITYSRTNTAEAVGPYEGVLTASYTENKNYSVTVVPGNFEIKTASIAGASLSATGGSWTYDGKAHSASASVTGAEYYTVYYKVGSGEWTTTAPSVTNVEDGEVTVSVKATRTGYEDLTAEDVKIKINARPVTITVDSKEKYFGTEDPTFTGSITSGSLVATNDLGTITYSRTNTAEAVGPYEGVLTASYTENKNYSVTVVPGTFTITAKSIVPDPENPDEEKDVTVNSPSDAVYDGNEHKWEPTVTYLGTTLVKDTDYEVSYDTTDFTNVNSKITVTITGKGNFTGEVTREYKITPRSVKLTSESATKVFDDEPLTRPDVTITGDGFVDGEVTNVIATGTITNIGNKTNKIEYTTGPNFKESNYSIEISEGTLTITPKSIVPVPETPDAAGNGIEVSELEDLVYNGQVQEQRPTVNDNQTGKLLVENTDYTLTFSDDTKNAGIVTVKVEGINNYEGDFDITYEITPAPVKVTTGSASKVFDDKPLTNGDITVEGIVEGETYEAKTTGSQTIIGTSENRYEITWGNEDNEFTALENNYEVVEEELGTLTVNPAPAPEVVPPNPGRTCQDDGYPEGYTWDEGQQACVCTADVCRVPEHPQPGNGGEQLPEETDEPVVVEEEVTPTTPAPEVEEIVEEETPLVAGRSWALVNLIACITGAVLAIVLLIMKKSKSEELEDEYDENGMKIEKTDEEKEDEAIPYIRKTMWKVVTAIVAIVAVIVFFLTEDMRLPMVMVDKWTLLMIIFALVNVLSLVLGMKWHEDEKVVNIVGNSATVAYNGSMQEVQGYTTDINTKKIEVTLKKDAKDEVSGVNVGRYNMGLTADCFEVKSDVYSNIKLVVTDGYLDIKAKD